MPAKSKATQAVTTPAPTAPKTKMKIVGPAIPVLSEHEIDEKLEQIRIRGAQISADLDALSRKLGLS